jgi:phage shock protein C
MAKTKTKAKSKTKSTSKVKKTYKRFYRPKKERVIGGVASGIAQYFDELDPILVRLGFLFLFFAGASAFPIYILLWIIMPSEESASEIASPEVFKENADEMKDKAQEYVHTAEDVVANDSNKLWVGLIIMVFGGVLLMKNFGLFYWIDFGDLWPLLLIVLGVTLIIRK